MAPSEQVPERPARFLRGLASLLLLVYLALGACFILYYRSADPTWGPWTPRYVLGVIVPFLLAATAGLAMVAMPAASARALGILKRPPRWLAAALAAAVILAGVFYAASISDERISIYMLILPAPWLALAWSRASGSVEVLLPGCLILLLGSLLFALELPDLLSGSPLVTWGDQSTFAYLFPREAPFIGPGGRLRPNLYARMRAPEYPRGALLITNSEGFRNLEEFPREASAGRTRILSLGDSFSTGFCADQDAFFGSLLAAELQAEVMNAEVSDPAYGLWYLQQHGMTFHPDLVLYGLSGNDLMQAEQFYGGDRLFRLDSRGRLEPNVAFNPAVESAWIRLTEYAYPQAGRATAPSAPGAAARLGANLSRFGPFGWMGSRSAQRAVPMPGYAEEAEARDGRLRLIDGAANLGFFYARDQRPVDLMYEAGFALLEAMRRTAAAGGAKFLVVVHPQRYQVQPADWEAMRNRWNLRPADFDLTLANRRLAEMASARGIELCDLREPLARAALTGPLYLPAGDTHYNRHGHQAAAEAVARALTR